MPHIVIGAHVNHLVDMACLTEFQKLENLIYLETGAQLIIAIISTISWIGNTSTLQGGKGLPSEREHRTKEEMHARYVREDICSV